MLLLCRVVLLSLLFQLISSDDNLINEALEDKVDIKQSTAADKVTELNSNNETFDTSFRENVPVGIQSRDAYSARHGNVISPANTLSLVGKSVSLKCRGRSTKVQWSFLPVGSITYVMIVHGHCKVDARYIDDYDVDTTDQACNLVIDSVTMDLAGTYTCDDRSTRSSAASARLIVLESEPSCKSSADREKFLTAGTEVRFSCSVHYSGALAPVMTWTDEFGQVMSSSAMDNESYVESSLVVKAKADALSRYYCRTYFNKFPPVQTSKHVTVANNTIDYVYPWTSKSVLVKPRCPSNFQYSSQTGLCYKINVQQKRWSDANEACRTFHPSARLVVINNEQEQSVLKAAINDLSKQELSLCAPYGPGYIYFFTSGQRKVFNDCSSSFVWRPSPELPERDVRNIIWVAGEPNCAKRQENCIVMWYERNIDLNDQSCEDTLCSICQLTI